MKGSRKKSAGAGFLTAAAPCAICVELSKLSMMKIQSWLRKETRARSYNLLQSGAVRSLSLRPSGHDGPFPLHRTPLRRCV